ncbi:helix-turn-helix domain-containing protein [Spirillospora sp. NPDC048911]|uniref:helix-turn-helix domain-containing protein n=1 Tax=Spirillospora sp. NPDC048911 TaxID=3364527 RepID=UPI0037178643
MPLEPHRLITELKVKRLAAGLSAREAARRAGLGETAVCDWESGRCQPTVVALEAYMALFGLGLIGSDVATRHEEAMRRLALEAMHDKPTAPADDLEPITPEQAAENRAVLAKDLGFVDDLPASDPESLPVREAA